jgi:hypothetical protein
LFSKKIEVLAAELKKLWKTPAQPPLPGWGVLATQLVTGLFSTADTADQDVTGFFSELLRKPWKTRATAHAALMPPWLSASWGDEMAVFHGFPNAELIRSVSLAFL